MPFANKKIREIWMSMVNTTYKTTEDLIKKLQSLKGKRKLKFYENKSNYYDNMNIKMDEDTFARSAQSISKLYHENLFLMIFVQTKAQFKNMYNNYYDFYYTVIRNKDEKEIVDNQYENDYKIFNDIIPNNYIGRKIITEILMYHTHIFIHMTLV